MKSRLSLFILCTGILILSQPSLALATDAPPAAPAKSETKKNITVVVLTAKPEAVHAAALQALAGIGCEVKKDSPLSIEGKRSNKVGLAVGSGGEKLFVEIKVLGDGKTEVTVTTKKTMVGIVGQSFGTRKSPPRSAMRSNKTLGLGLAVLLGLTGCISSVQPTAFPVGAKRLPAKPAGTTILLFKDTPPSRPFAAVAQLNVHIEKTFFIPTAFAEALPQLEELARQQGADALTNIVEKKSRLNETFIYNVTATAVAFTASP